MGQTGYYIYNETEPKRPFSDRMDFDPNVMYLRHYANYLELAFICRSTSGSNRFQAERELGICEKKLEYWKKMSGWAMSECSLEIQRLKRMWEVSAVQDRWSQ